MSTQASLFPPLPPGRLRAFKELEKPNYADELLVAHRVLDTPRRALLKMLGIATNAVVLDVGCFDGYHARAVADLVPSARIVGIDVNEWNIAKANELTDPSYKERDRVRFFLANAAPTGNREAKAAVDGGEHPSAWARRKRESMPPGENPPSAWMPYQDAAFTDILCICNLQNIPALDVLCNECVRTLRPDGRMHVIEQSVDLGLSLETKATITRALAARYEGKRQGPDAGQGAIDLAARLRQHGFVPQGTQTVMPMVIRGPLEGDMLTFASEQLRTLWDRLIKNPAPDAKDEVRRQWERMQPHIGAAVRAELESFEDAGVRAAYFQRNEATIVVTDYAATGVKAGSAAAAAGSHDRFHDKDETIR